ncbi:MAG: hypothetical protein VX764_04500 [Planctomycetota bacterium]|nr:hypothetical protein [Planctomycetota bacterium]
MTPIFRWLTPLGLLVVLLTPLAADTPTDKSVDDAAPAPFVLQQEERSRILDLFQASSEAISPDGVLQLTYDFTSNDEVLGEDWIPIPTNPYGRIGQPVRWIRGSEGGVVGVSRGIFFADKGQWFHRALWRPQVKLETTYYSFCGGSNGDMFAAVYGWTKGLRRRVGSNLGAQLLKISGVKATGGLGKAPVIIFKEPVPFGFDLKDGTFHAQHAGRTTQQSDSSKFVKKLDSGQVGFVWNGNIRGCIGKLTLRGQLDLDWAAKSIPALKKRLAEYNKKKPKS